jgi:hypothetical protein
METIDNEALVGALHRERLQAPDAITDSRSRGIRLHHAD